MTRLVSVLAVAALVCAGCAATTPAVTNPTTSAAAASSSISATTTPVDAATVSVCRAAVNELGRNDLGHLISQILVDGNFKPIALATPFQQFKPITAGAAEPKVGAAVNDLNDSIGRVAPVQFPDYTAALIEPVTAAYTDLTTWCTVVGVSLPT